MGRLATDEEAAIYLRREHKLRQMFLQGERDQKEVLDLFQNVFNHKSQPAAVAVQPPADLLTPVDQLVARFMARNELRNWGFTADVVAQLTEQLAGHVHAGTLLPVSLAPWLGSLERTWAEALLWALDTAGEVGLETSNYLEGIEPTFYKGSEVKSRQRKLGIIGLDFQTYFNPTNGIVPDNVRPQRKHWPTTEVPFFLGLNPGYLKAMDGDKLPWLMAPGLVVSSGGVPGFDRYERGFFANYGWSGDCWSCTAMVAFREL